MWKIRSFKVGLGQSHFIATSEPQKERLMATAELVADGKMGKPHTQLGGLAACPQRKEGGRGRAADRRRRCRPFLNGRPPVRCLEQVVHNDVCADGRVARAEATAAAAAPAAAATAAWAGATARQGRAAPLS